MIPDTASYTNISIEDQGKSPECVVYAALGVVKKMIKSKYDLTVDFDYSLEYDRAMSYRRTSKAHNKHAPFLSIHRALVTVGILYGFKPVGHPEITVYVTGFNFVKNNFNNICAAMLKSPVIGTVKLFEGHDFSPNNMDLIGDLPKKLKLSGYHRIFFKSYDRDKQLLEIQNSWGEPSKWIKWDVLEKMLTNCHSIKDIEVKKSL